MEYFQKIMSGPYKYIAIVFLAYILIYIPYYLRMRKKHAGEVEQFLSENPFAAKVYIKSGTNILTSGEMTVHSVNNKKPVLFSEKLKAGFYAAVGENEISVSYSWTRPGVMHKSVTTEIETSRQIIEVEAGKEYTLDFDRDANKYVFSEK